MSTEATPTCRGWTLIGDGETIVHQDQERKIHDSAMSKDGKIFRKSENVLLLSGEDQPYFAHILYFYLDDSTNTVYMCVNWFYRADEAVVSNKRKRPKMEAYDILYNSHEDDNPADSIIAAISLTCDPEKMVGIEKQHREYDYLCRYEYHVGKNGKKLSIKKITKEREEQLLKYRTIKRATYEANLEKEKNIQAEKKKKKEDEKKKRKEEAEKKKKAAAKKKAKELETKRIAEMLHEEQRKRDAQASREVSHSSSFNTSPMFKASNILSAGSSKKKGKNIIKIKKKKNVQVVKEKKSTMVTNDKTPSPPAVKPSKNTNVNKKYGKRKKMAEDPIIAQQREKELQKEYQRRQELQEHVLRMPVATENIALRKKRNLAMKAKKRKLEQKKLAKSNRVKRAQEKEVPLPPHLRRRKKKNREKRDTYKKIKRDTYISGPHKTNTKHLYDTKRLFQLSRYLKNEWRFVYSHFSTRQAMGYKS